MPAPATNRSVPRLAVVLALVCLGVAVLVPSAAALDCRNTPLAERLDLADQAFVGRVTGERAVPRTPRLRYYRFAVEQVIKTKHPEFKEVRVKRVLPSRIDIELRRRTPIAQVYFSRYVQMDRELVLMPGSSATPFN